MYMHSFMHAYCFPFLGMFTNPVRGGNCQLINGQIERNCVYEDNQNQDRSQLASLMYKTNLEGVSKIIKIA